MASEPEPTWSRDGVAFWAAFRRAIRPAASAGATLIVLAGPSWVLTRPVTDAPLVGAGAAWAIAVVAAVVSAGRRRPGRSSSITAHVVALLGAAAVSGAFRGSLPGVLAALAGLVFFVVAVGSAVLRADDERPRQGSPLS